MVVLVLLSGLGAALWGLHAVTATSWAERLLCTLMTLVCARIPVLWVMWLLGR